MRELPLLRWDEITRIDAPWAYLVPAGDRDIDNHIRDQAETTPDCVTRVIRGERCESPDRLFQEWAAAFQFPYYFGHNWDALWDCMTDLDWLFSRTYVVVLTHIDKVLPSQDDDGKTYIHLLGDAVKEWGSRKNPVAFRVVFHCREENRLAAESRLELSGVTPEIRRSRFFARPFGPDQ